MRSCGGGISDGVRGGIKGGIVVVLVVVVWGGPRPHSEQIQFSAH